MLAAILIPLVVVVAIIIIIFLVGIGLYNSIVSLRNRIDNAWAQIDVQLRKRYDLIPNLVETVKGYAAHESQTLEKVIQARSIGMDAKSVTDQAKAENMITSTLKSLFAVAENYPNLKANENFLQLQEELSGTESKIAYARQFYNDSVMGYNIKVETFPTNFFANMFGYKKRDMFQAPEGEKKNVKVQF